MIKVAMKVKNTKKKNSVMNGLISEFYSEGTKWENNQFGFFALEDVNGVIHMEFSSGKVWRKLMELEENGIIDME